MENKTYIKCNLYSIRDDFSISENKSVDDTIIDCDKKLLRTIIVNIVFGRMTEFLTGVEFDYSDVKIYEQYSKFRKKYVIKEKNKVSTQPIHVGLFSENLSTPYVTNANYEYADYDDIKEYYHKIIVEFDTIKNYTNYLLTLKQMANDKLDDAIRDHERSKRITLTRII